MSAVDDRVVAMKFDSSQFDGNAQKSMGILDKLKASLNFDKQTKAMGDLTGAAGHFTLNGLQSGIKSAAGGFSALSVAGVAALATLVSSAVSAGVRIVKALTFDNIKAGFASYNEQINATQVIMANTAAAGTKMKDVEGTLKVLQTYAQQTVYSFSDMTSNIGRFTAAGVGLQDATDAIKGMANVAALSGATTQQMSSAMYQMSQALSTGVIRLQDWNSLSQASMAGQGIQDAIKETAQAAKDGGKPMEEAIKKQGSFRDSLKEGWLTSDIYTKAMKVMGGTVDKTTGKFRAFSVEELKGMGYNEKSAESLHKLSQSALDSATKIRTLPQLLAALKEEVAGAYGNVFKTIFGNLKQATKLFTALHTVAESALTTPINNLNTLLQDATKMGARANIFKGFEVGAKNLLGILKPIKDAFRQIFPKTTASDILEASKAFLAFAQSLKIGKGTADLIKRSFAGLFAVFDIGWQFIKALLGALGNLFGFMQQNSGGVLTLTASFGDFLVKLDDAVKKTGIFKQIFQVLGTVLSKPMGIFKAFAGILSAFFSNLDAHPLEAVSNYLTQLTGSSGPASKAVGLLSRSWEMFLNVMGNIGRMIKPAWDGLKDLGKNLMTALSQSFAKGDFTPVYAVLNNLLMGGLMVTIHKIFSKKSFNIDFGGGVVESIKNTFGALTGTLKAMQTQVQAKTLLEIAGAVGILTASIVVLSMIKTSKLASAMTGIAAAFAILLGAMTVLTKITGVVGTLKMDALVAALIGLAIGMLILSASVKILSDMSWEDLSKGLLGVALLLAMLAGAAKLFDSTKGGMAKAALTIIPLAAGLLLLSLAVKSFASMTWGDMAKGMAGMAGGLLIIAGAMAIMPKDIALKAVGLVILASAISIMANALTTMGGMGWESIAKAMVVLAGSLAILAGGLAIMTEGLPGAAALIVAAGALSIMAAPLQSFGNMSWEGIAKSMVVLFGALTLLALGMLAMEAGLPGAAALVVASFALDNIARTMTTLGELSWGQVLIGLVALAGALTIIGVAALLLAPLTPVIDALGAGIFLLGAALLAAGLGALAFASAFALLAAVGTAGAAVLVGIINLIPLLATQLAVGLGAFITTMLAQEGLIGAAWISIGGTIIDAITALIPKMQALMAKLIPAMASSVSAQAPVIINTFVHLILMILLTMQRMAFAFGAIGTQIIANFIRGVAANIGSVVRAATNLITNFLTAIGNAGPKLADAGVKTIIKLVNGIADGIRRNKAAMNAAGRNLGSAIVEGLTAGISGAAHGAITAAINVARNAIAAAKRALGVNSPSKEFMALGEFSSQGLAIGIANEGRSVNRSASSVATSALDTVRKSMSGLKDAVSGQFDSVVPTITPVLDLTDVTKKAGTISSLLSASKISPTVSLGQASGIANSEQISSTAVAMQTPVKHIEVKLEQVNNSPKALDPIEIYRNTKSQMSMLKEALKE